MFEDLIEVHSEYFPNGVLNSLQHEDPVLIIDQPVDKHSPNFMGPQPHQNVRRLNPILITHADSVDHFGEVS